MILVIIVSKISNTRDDNTVHFMGISKQQEKSWKHINVQGIIFDVIWVVWIVSRTLALVYIIHIFVQWYKTLLNLNLNLN